MGALINVGAVDERGVIVLAHSARREIFNLEAYLGCQIGEIPDNDLRAGAVARCMLDGKRRVAKIAVNRGLTLEVVFQKAGNVVVGYGKISGAPNLTPREIQVVQLLADDLTVKQVARRLGVTASTVDSHRQNAMAKMHCETTHGLIAQCMRAGLLG